MWIPASQYPPLAPAHYRDRKLRLAREPIPERPHGGAAQDILDAAVEEAIGHAIPAEQKAVARF